MPKFDWNGNEKKDNFDRFMDMKVISEVSKDESDYSSDLIDDFDDNDDLFEEKSEDVENNDIDYAINQQVISNQSTTFKEGSFQNELKKNMKAPEQVQKEKTERDKQSAKWEAERTLSKIKEYLMYNVKHAEYEKEDGVTFVSCTCGINRHYLSQEWYDNSTELKKDKETFFLFRDPSLIYKTGYYYDIKPYYQNEYNYFINALKELASKEKISIETVLVKNEKVLVGKEVVNKEKVFPFPCKIESSVGSYARLCVKATIIISGDSSKKIKTVKKQIDESVVQQQKMQEQNSGNLAMTGKCFLVVGIIILAFIICLNTDIGPLGMALLLIGSVVFGCIILMKNSK